MVALLWICQNCCLCDGVRLLCLVRKGTVVRSVSVKNSERQDLIFDQVGSSRADWPPQGACGGRVQHDTVFFAFAVKKIIQRVAGAGKVQAAAAEL